MSKNKQQDKVFHETIEREYKRLRAADSKRPLGEIMGEIRGEHYPFDGSGLSDRAWRKAIDEHQKLYDRMENKL